MPTYLYEALNSAGQSQKGTVEAGSSEEAVKQIKTQGYFPTAVREQKVKGGAGVGGAERVSRVEIRWPCGKTAKLEDVPVDQTIVVTEDPETRSP